MSPDKAYALLHYLDRSAHAELDPFKALLFQRDALAFLFEWKCAMRGDNACRLELSDFRHLNSVPGSPSTRLVAFPIPSSQIPPGFGLQIEPHGTKTVQGRRASPIVLYLDPAPTYCLIRRVSAFVALSSVSGLTPGCPVTKYLICPLEAGHRDFSQTSLGSSALNKRLETHLIAAGLDEGETSHSLVGVCPFKPTRLLVLALRLLVLASVIKYFCF
jgi:integrase